MITRLRSGWLTRAAALGLTFLGASAGLAQADTIAISYSPAGERYANTAQLCTDTVHCWYGTENFSGWSGGDFTSSFTTGASSLGAGVSFSGQYSALNGTTSDQWKSMPQDQYGGTGGSNYPELFGPGAVAGPNGQTESAYQVTLSATGLPTGKGINYFGVWISALDPYNDLRIYNTSGGLIAEFDSATLLAALGSCSNGPNPYCGNPTTSFAGQDSGELFAFVNVFDLDGSIGSVVFYNGGGTGFESENDTVAYIDPIHVYGSTLAVPEPTSLAVFGSGLLGFVGLRRRRRG